MPIAPFFITEGKTYSGTARILASRIHGGVTFMQARFNGERIQLMLLRDATADYDRVKRLSTGTLVTMEGMGCKTRSGQNAIKVSKLSVLARCNRSLPDKHKGISDENRHRDRALLRLVDDEVFAFDIAVAEMTRATRMHLYDNGFHEFNTGILQGYFEGGLARPFTVRCNANGREYALSLTSELKLKRLIIAGCERVCEITQSFRNEGMDSAHSPEFTLLEAYQVDASVEDMADLVEAMARRAVSAFLKRFTWEHAPPARTDFLTRFARTPFATLYREHVDPEGFDDEALKRLAARNPDQFDVNMPRFTWVMKAIERFIGPQLVHPTFLTDIPSGLSPLVRTDDNHPEVSRRAFFFANKTFIADLYEDESRSEIIEAAMRQQAETSDRPINQDYLDLLSFGIPPTAGIGMGLNRLFMALLPIAGLPAHIKETTPFPL